ncbi:MAG: DUF882 domain-containing protein [Rhizobiaceae bacterium]
MKSASFQDPYGKTSYCGTSARSGLVFLTIFLFSLAYEATISAHAETRTLKMYFTHTRESATITFKKNGKYISSGLKKANRFLRDWRRKEPTKMDPALLDLVWEVYQQSGSRQPIKVISGYRSPRTNNMLRRRGRKVAKTSQHTRGKALDFFLPDVSVSKLRALGLKAHRGGVGYYAGSFVHLDTGSVRHWPRMSSRQLKKVFPRGKTIHVPSNGRPLKGYKTARANLRKGLNADGSSRTTNVRKTLLATLFNNNSDSSDQNEGATPASRPVLNKPVPVAALPNSRKKPSGPDPFSLENRAVASSSQPQLPQGRIAVPRTRPQAPAGNGSELLIASAEPATAPNVSENSLRPATTELALAAPPALPNVLRPAADIPEVSDKGQATAAPTASELTRAPEPPRAIVAPTPRAPVVARASAPVTSENFDLSRLNLNVETALARGRIATPSESAAEQQSNGQLAEKLKSVAVPGRPEQRPAETQLALAALPQPTPRSSRLTAAEPEPESLVDSSRFASLEDTNTSTPSLRQRVNPELKPELNPELRPELIAASADRLKVPLPSASPVREQLAVAATSSGPTDSNSEEYDLSLGDLDGYSVKKWAVSLSTRVGPGAVLTAPNYRQSTLQQAPDRVYSAGFARARFTLRSDSFSGRALTRVAFAKFENN